MSARPGLKALLHVFAVFPCASLVSAGESSLPIDKTTVDAAVERIMKERNVPGCVVGIVLGSDLAYSKAFGVANVETKAPMQVDTRFQIGSVTKTFTATLACILRDQGRLSLDDPISKFLPADVKVPQHPLGRPITIAHLATHTSGLPSNPINRRDVPESPSVMEPYSIKELYDVLPRTGVATPPGRQWSYSNLGFGLLGHLLERAGGNTYEELLREHIFAPLGMKDSHVAMTNEDQARLACHCWPADSPRVARKPWVFGEVSGFGGIISSVPDMAKYVSLQLRAADPPAPFTTASILEWRTPRHLINERTWQSAMGLGWWITRHEEFGNLLTHGGEVDGHSSSVVISTTHGVGVVVLAIVGADTAEAIGREVLPQAFRPATEQMKQLEDYRKAEDWTKVRDIAASVVVRYPEQARAQYELGYASLKLGDLKAGAEASLLASRFGYQPQLALYNAACGYARLGDKDAAFTHLRQAVAIGFRDRNTAMTDPDLANLRDDPRWTALSRGE